MTKEVQIGTERVLFKSSAALPIVYRRLTGNDLFIDMQNLSNGGDRLLDIAWAMYRHAHPDDLTEEEAWLERFEFMDVNNALAVVMDMLTEEQKSSSITKKKNVS